MEPKEWIETFFSPISGDKADRISKVREVAKGLCYCMLDCMNDKNKAMEVIHDIFEVVSECSNFIARE